MHTRASLHLQVWNGELGVGGNAGGLVFDFVPAVGGLGVARHTDHPVFRHGLVLSPGTGSTFFLMPSPGR